MSLSQYSHRVTAFSVLFTLAWAMPMWAFQDHTDLSATVEVAKVFSLSMDKSTLAFNALRPGETHYLEEGRHFNKLTCQSNTGRAWYLKVSVESIKHVNQPYSLPTHLLKMKVTDSTGSAQPKLGSSGFEALSDGALTIYESQDRDSVGKPVELSLQYSLTLPKTAPAGDYVGQVVFSLSEAP